MGYVRPFPQTARQRVRAATVSTVLRIRHHAPEDAILLSCDPRSGSTWLSELLYNARPSAVIWEPFHRDHVPQVRALDFAWRQYIPADADWPEAERLVRRILSGGVINQWTGWASPLADFARAERLIVKCCRANGFLPWLVRRVAFRKKPIHFLRHPFAIAASQLRMGNFDTSGMDADLERGRYAGDLAESAAYIRGLRRPEEKIVAMWCRTQKPALTDPVTRTRVIRICYETLTLSPQREIARLYANWGESVPDGTLSQITQASRMTQDASQLANPANQVGKWQQFFDDRQISRMARILRDFEIPIYDENPLPCATPMIGGPNGDKTVH